MNNHEPNHGVTSPTTPVTTPEPSISTAPAAPSPAENARLLARAGGNNLHIVEEYARAYERSAQGGQREVIHAALSDNERRLKAHKKSARVARRRFNRQEETIRSKELGVPMPWWVIAMFVMCLAGWLAGLLAEHYGASSALLATGAFNVNSIAQGMLITSTAIAVGFALKLAYRTFSPGMRRWIFGTSCSLLVTLFAIWGWNFANEVGKSDVENQRAGEFQSGENIGDGQDISAIGESGEAAARETDSSSTWRMFGALIGMMVLTTFVGMVGMEVALGAYDARIPNPERARAQDEINFHDNEVSRLGTEQGALNQQLAQFADCENAAAAAARAEFLAARTAA